MKRERIKTLVAAAAKLPPAKGRALLRTVAAKAAQDASEASAEYLETAASAMAAAMESALLAELETTLQAP